MKIIENYSISLIGIKGFLFIFFFFGCTTKYKYIIIMNKTIRQNYIIIIFGCIMFFISTFYNNLFKDFGNIVYHMFIKEIYFCGKSSVHDKL